MLRVLGMLHLHEEEIRVLAGHVLLGREEVKPLIWPSHYLREGRVGSVLDRGMQAQKKGEILIPAGLR